MYYGCKLFVSPLINILYEREEMVYLHDNNPILIKNIERRFSDVCVEQTNTCLDIGICFRSTVLGFLHRSTPVRLDKD